LIFWKTNKKFSQSWFIYLFYNKRLNIFFLIQNLKSQIVLGWQRKMLVSPSPKVSHLPFTTLTIVLETFFCTVTIKICPREAVLGGSTMLMWRGVFVYNVCPSKHFSQWLRRYKDIGTLKIETKSVLHINSPKKLEPDLSDSGWKTHKFYKQWMSSPALLASRNFWKPIYPLNNITPKELNFSPITKFHKLFKYLGSICILRDAFVMQSHNC